MEERMKSARDKNLERLLNNKKLHLILDLDNTLVHHTKVTLDERQEFIQTYRFKTTDGIKYRYDDDTNGGLYPIFDWLGLVKLRPGIRTFLKQASHLFELSIYTMGSRRYAHAVARLLDPSRVLFGGRIISKENCTTQKQKGLDVVRYHPQVVLIVDDKVEVWAESDRSNVVTLAPYAYFHNLIKHAVDHCDRYGDDDDVKFNDDFDAEDKELATVLDVLREVHSTFFDSKAGPDYMTRDVAQVLESVRVQMISTITDQPPQCNATLGNSYKRDHDHHHMISTITDQPPQCNATLGNSYKRDHDHHHIDIDIDIDKVVGSDDCVPCMPCAKRPRADSQEQCQ